MTLEEEKYWENIIAGVILDKQEAIGKQEYSTAATLRGIEIWIIEIRDGQTTIEKVIGFIKKEMVSKPYMNKYYCILNKYNRKFKIDDLLDA